MRTDQEIVDQTNELARLCLRFIGTGYEVPEGHKFYEANDPRSQRAWKMACEIQEHMTATDPNDALANIEEPKEYRIRIGVTARVFTTETFTADSWEQAVEKAKAYNPREFRFTYDHEDIEGDEIAYLREDGDERADEFEVDLREAGEPYSWVAVELVKELAKRKVTDDLGVFVLRARDACATA